MQQRLIQAWNIRVDETRLAVKIDHEQKQRCAVKQPSLGSSHDYRHLLFAVVTTAYMILAVFVEERDLVQHFGDAYRRYQETTPKYVPRFGRKTAGRRATATVTS